MSRFRRCSFTIERTARAAARSSGAALLAAAVVAACTGRDVHAQSPADSARADSLAELADRLARAEDVLQELRRQMREVQRDKAGTKTRTAVTLSGRLVMHTFLTTGRSTLNDVPTLALPPLGTPGVAPRVQGGSFGGTFRQSLLAIGLEGRRMWGATASAHADVDFAGGVQEGAGGRRLFPEPRLRVATASLVWSRGFVSIGQDVPLVADVLPSSPAAIAVPLFATAGNLWYWLPQLRLGVQRGAALRVGVDGAVVAPWSGFEFAGADTADRIDLAERSRRPFLQSRLRLSWGTGDREGMLALAGHLGWLARPTGELADSRAVAIQVRAPVGEFVEIRGVAYRGQALRGLGGGGVAQNFATDGAPLRDLGGWAQLLITPRHGLTGAAGCGESNPDDAQLVLRRRNRQCEASITWRPGGLPVIALAWRRVGTEYAAGTFVARHLNLATGFVF